MFKFNFTNEDLGLEDDASASTQAMADLSVSDTAEEKVADSRSEQLQSCEEILPTYLIKGFPETLQAEPVKAKVPVDLFRRTLADVKYQLAQEDTLEDESQSKLLDLVDTSDLVKGVYEGGFKTWECSVDLVEYLAANQLAEQWRDKQVLELGCGSALPGLYALKCNDTVHVDFQDYNRQVITHITIPNSLLNVAFKPFIGGEGDPCWISPDNDKASSSSSQGNEDDEVEDEDEEDEEDEQEYPEAHIPSEKLPAALEALQTRSRFFAGDWRVFPSTCGKTYDVILSSETIYSPSSIPVLINTIKDTLAKPNGVAYIAAKTIYFGVGGGTLTFREQLLKARDKQGDRFKLDVLHEVTGHNTARLEQECKAAEAELDRLTTELSELQKELGLASEADADAAVDNHIQQLHDYNDIKDVAQVLLSKLAAFEGAPLKEIYNDFDIPDE